MTSPTSRYCLVFMLCILNITVNHAEESNESTTLEDLEETTPASVSSTTESLPSSTNESEPLTTPQPDCYKDGSNICLCNEKWTKCLPKDQPTCQNQSTSNVENDEDCIEEGCNCIDGYVRDAITKHCIKKERCSELACNETNHEVYSTCGPPCPETCKEAVRAGRWGLIRCDYKCEPGCYCKEGYVRDEDECIPKVECKRNK